MIEISITDNTGAVQSEMRAIAAQLVNPTALYKDVGRGLANQLKKHFAKREQDNPNKLGGARTHWWLEVRDAVQQAEIVPDGVSVSIVHPAFPARVYGATVRPQRASALTIPIHKLAYGRRARVFESETGKKLFRLKGKRVLMADFDGDIVPIYALVKSARIPKDPDALPEDAAIIGEALTRSRKHLARMLARQSV